ncbi:MAG: hypothetical protein M3406_09785 [Chloroflexota bacterium]|nr:hypothetical protein [Chloroflexota bacterium]
MRSRNRAVPLAVMLTVGLAACAPDLLPTPQECNGALLTGVLAPDGGDGAVVMADGIEYRVVWPDGYIVERGPPVRLRDSSGNLVASAGETIYLGGGTGGGDRTWVACGHVSRDPP